MKTFKTKQKKNFIMIVIKCPKIIIYLPIYMYICIYAQNYLDCELFHPSAVYPLHQFTKRERERAMQWREEQRRKPRKERWEEIIGVYNERETPQHYTKL